jgi:type IV pilus assembly protein PilN
LPWREELRQKRKKEFAMLALGAVLMAAAVTFGTKTYYKGEISNQQSRNQMLRAEITELDRQIAEIDDLDRRKRRLLERMEIIDDLERTTPEAVTMIDSLVDIMPDGTHLTAVAQQGTRVELDGRSQSNGRVADLLRNVDGSQWIRDPYLDRVITEGSGALREGQFKIRVNQVRIRDLGEEQ